MTNTSNPAIAAAIAAANKSKAAVPAVAAETPAPVAAMVPLPTAGRITLEERLAKAGLKFSNWLSVTDSGLKINKGNPPQETIAVTLVIDEVEFGTGIRWQPPGGAVAYEFTADGLTGRKSGRPWAEIVEKAQQLDPKARPYDSSNIPFKLAQRVVVKSPQPATYEPGTLVGFSTTYATEQEFQKFLADAVAKFGRSAEIKISLGMEMRTFSTPAPVITFTIISDA